MSESFGKILKRYRKEADLTQDELIKRVNARLEKQGISDNLLVQATLSGWETDRQLPSGKTALLEAIQAEIGLPSEVIKSVQEHTGRRGGRAPDDEYTDDVREWVRSAIAKVHDEKDHPRIWFLVPNVLPAFIDGNNRVTHLWAENISKGVQYRLLWILEETQDKRTFRELHKQIDVMYDFLKNKPEGKQGGALADKVNPPLIERKETILDDKKSLNHGDLKVYLVRLPFIQSQKGTASTDAQVTNSSVFKRQCDAWNERLQTWQGEREDDGNWIKWYDLGQFKDDGDEGYDAKLHHKDRRIYDLIENIRSQTLLFGRVAVYLSSDASGEDPQAGLLLTETSERFGGGPNRIYRWFCEEDANDLGSSLDEIEPWIQERERRAQAESGK